jgi:putative transposase
LATPRDRDGSFEPELVKKGQTRIDGVDDKIIGLYAAGLSVRDIQAHLEELYGLRVSPDLISRVTDAVLDEVREWQHRALERMRLSRRVLIALAGVSSAATLGMTFTP